MSKLREKQEKLLKIIEENKAITTVDLMKYNLYSSRKSLHHSILRLMYRDYPIDFIPFKSKGNEKVNALYYLKGEERISLELLREEYHNFNIDYKRFTAAERKLRKILEDRNKELIERKLTDFIKGD